MCFNKNVSFQSTDKSPRFPCYFLSSLQALLASLKYDSSRDFYDSHESPNKSTTLCVCFIETPKMKISSLVWLKSDPCLWYMNVCRGPIWTHKLWQFMMADKYGPGTIKIISHARKNNNKNERSPAGYSCASFLRFLSLSRVFLFVEILLNIHQCNPPRIIWAIFLKTLLSQVRFCQCTLYKISENLAAEK